MTDVAELLDTLVPPLRGHGRLEPRPPRRQARPPPARAALPARGRRRAGGGDRRRHRALAGEQRDRRIGARPGSGRDRRGRGAASRLRGRAAQTLVDLETGERTELRSQHEVWFDPEAGFRQTETFDGVVQFDAVVGPDEMSEHTTSIYSSLGAGYREALESGRAEVVGEETVDGTGVYWIHIEDGHDVAVSKNTYEPVYIRVTMNGSPALTRIVSYETVEPGSAPLDAESTLPGPQDVTTAYGAEIDLADAASLLGREPVWAGSSLHGFPLDAVRSLSLPTTGRRRSRPEHRVRLG